MLLWKAHSGPGLPDRGEETVRRGGRRPGSYSDPIRAKGALLVKELWVSRFTPLPHLPPRVPLATLRPHSRRVRAAACIYKCRPEREETAAAGSQCDPVVGDVSSQLQWYGRMERADVTEYFITGILCRMQGFTNFECLIFHKNI
ncbi:hypothetical protein NDU88_005564 [Pleurodeles waltl]|uniref:Uncharacterized protein n=1 Tax=Pleurodeles waltl TaxID=8319 RepID=A0AAV7N0X4_PLEWA|nr:hypothetical protein NDU88_005564 [Pleurodeles waltl]